MHSDRFRHLAVFFLCFSRAISTAHAGILDRGQVQLICHRIANRSYQLWDRIGADRAEWVLVKAGPAVLPRLRQALLNL